jgi:hypothetical protein
MMNGSRASVVLTRVSGSMSASCGNCTSHHVGPTTMGWSAGCAASRRCRCRDRTASSPPRARRPRHRSSRRRSESRPTGCTCDRGAGCRSRSAAPSRTSWCAPAGWRLPPSCAARSARRAAASRSRTRRRRWSSPTRRGRCSP